MKTVIKSEPRLFSSKNIDLSADEISRFLDSAQVERREALSIKLTLEEVLLNYQGKFGEGASYIIKCVKIFSNIRIEVIVPGESFDPLEKDGEEDDVIQGLLARIGLAPTWSYKKGKNHTVFIPKKKPLSDTVKVALAIGFAVIAGFGLKYLPAGFTAGVNDYILTPVTDAFMGLIFAVSGPLIFLSILGSICSMGNIETFGKIGSKTIKTILLYMLVICGILTVLGCFLFRVKLGDGGSANFSQVLDLVYDIVPSNFFEPFVSGNIMQIIFIAVIFGIAMLALSSRVNIVFNFVEQLSSIVQMVMAGLSSLLPFLIFILFTGMISSGNIGAVLGSWKLIVIILILMFAYYIFYFLKVAISRKISPILLLKKVWPTFLIAMTTASSAAALVTNINDSEEKLGIDRKLAEFAIPMGQVLFMPDTFVLFFGLEIFFAQVCGIPITVPWLIIGFGTNFLLALAIPPVPGGNIMGLTIAFQQLGIPMEMMGLALAVNAIADFPGSATSVSGWQLTLIKIADSLDLLDKDVLQSDINFAPKKEEQ